MAADAALARIAPTQHGLITRRQAADLGFTAHQINHRVDTGRWLRRGDRVLVIAGTPPTFEHLALAAQLAAPGSVVSHHTAARLHRFTRVPDGPITISRLHGSKHAIPGVVVRQTRVLPTHHRCMVSGIVATSPARTLFDLAAVLTEDEYDRVADDQLASGRVSLQRLRRVHSELGGRRRPGSSVLRRLLAERGPGYVPPESELEAKFVELVARFGLPESVRQRRRPWGGAEEPGRADVAYEAQRLIVELDSRRHHTLVEAFERDRERDQLALAAGWRTIRFTWRQLCEQPERVASIIRAVLE